MHDDQHILCIRKLWKAASGCPVEFLQPPGLSSSLALNMDARPAMKVSAVPSLPLRMDVRPGRYKYSGQVCRHTSPTQIRLAGTTAVCMSKTKHRPAGQRSRPYASDYSSPSFHNGRRLFSPSPFSASIVRSSSNGRGQSNLLGRNPVPFSYLNAPPSAGCHVINSKATLYIHPTRPLTSSFDDSKDYSQALEGSEGSNWAPQLRPACMH
jgi:hypothetical protein